MLRRRKYFQGRSIRGGGIKDIAWLAPDGREMTDEAWNADFVRSLGMLLSGNAIEEVDERGEPIIGDTLLVLLNAPRRKGAVHAAGAVDSHHQWQRVIDTMTPRTPERAFRGASRYPLQGRSMAVFKMTPPIRERRRSLHSLIEHQPVEAAEPAPAAAEE